MVGGLILSQVLTLFTTPVVYLFDRLQQSFSQPDSSQAIAKELAQEQGSKS